MCVCVHMQQCMYRGGRQIWELDLPFLYVGPEDGTLVVRVGSRCLYTLNHFASLCPALLCVVLQIQTQVLIEMET